MTEMDANQPELSSAACDLPDGRIILFDAECILCSANAHFILRHDHHKAFYLASMQGEVGSQLFRRHGLDPTDPSTILVIDGTLVRKDSDAVISIYEGLGMPWRVAAVFRLIPAFLRDPIYRFVARNRYRIFGKREACWLPPAHLRSRVL
jgi:predicted DCC family thiol-disulfide oxidoreductase YuxK